MDPSKNRQSNYNSNNYFSKVSPKTQILPNYVSTPNYQKPIITSSFLKYKEYPKHNREKDIFKHKI